MPSAPPTPVSPETAHLSDLILRIVDELVQESGARCPPATLDSDLDRDLGFDSLGRVELVARIERACGVKLGDAALTVATPGELLRLALAGRPMGAPASLAREAEPPAVVAGDNLPTGATTLVEVLEWHAGRHAPRVYAYLCEEPEDATPLTYGDLHRAMHEVAAGLLARGLEPGQSVALMLPTGRAYLEAFFGILRAGCVPVPIYPPFRPAQLEDHLRRHVGILRNAEARLLVTVPEAVRFAHLLRAHVETLHEVVTPDALTRHPAGVAAWPPLKAENVALLQYTSGSTGDPKGVVLSHANLLANLRALGERIEVRADDVFVSWLPLYHDMGLIGAVLGTLYYGVPLVLMSPLAFLSRPVRWLKAIDRYRGTLSAAPNFAFELCLRHITDQELAGLDLSSWRLAANGAEPVSARTMRRFGERFARCGLRPQALSAVYGLAECSLGLALPSPGEGVRTDRIAREAFMRSGVPEPVAADGVDAIEIVACGWPLQGHEIRIVDEAGHELPERREGRLEFRGPSATSGYLRNPEATRRLFHGPWLDSGDLAYVADGQVYLTGRVKDVIIRAGRNIHPQEFEQAVGEIEGVRRGCVAVFGSRDPRDGTERLVVVAETRERGREAQATMERRIREAARSLLGQPPDAVVFVPPHSVLKTSSGKVRRAAVRELYERGTLGRGGGAVWWQIVRLGLGSLAPRLRRLVQRGGEALYAGYAWAAFSALITLAWSLVALLPGREQCWAVCRAAARLLSRCTATPLEVEGLERLPPGPCVLTVNHASYIDALVLTAAIPRSLRCVAKRELAGHWPVRVLLDRLGTVFVERLDPRESAGEAERLVDLASRGSTLAFFPEGTFDRRSGLRPFHMGAFVVAARAGLPVVPVAIRGTRSILRGGSWFPRRGRLRVVVEAPLQPAGAAWQAAVKLRDAARAAILRHCGEPDLGNESVSPV
ncbi:AMP-binding protein [Chelatococcus sp. SYSU_G07232]|uniref:AMP-binding protein n=1 Tax=Chelatococcus albus TaxID=3047466 RepID=A0ABT7ACB3_9HYPH|nr:AMP-binding protein [Chelatococcus sp. SYSU_G07232]MDJ1157008.1 AMP-binding protein [Chelatococcus sp. SYSU_G07232]